MHDAWPAETSIRPIPHAEDPDIAAAVHVPVLLQETLSALRPEPGWLVVDATVGAAGHASAVLPRILPGGHLVGVDRDPEILEIARSRLRSFGESVRLVHGNASEIDELLSREGFGGAVAHGVLFDFGVSSHQLDRPERGFSFDKDGFLDMRMDPRLPKTAADVVNRETETELARILWEYGEERFARRIARAIVDSRRRRPIRRTLELADLVDRTVRRGPSTPRRIHPATRTFQALRIAINDELSEIELALPRAVSALRPGGRLVAISFHSLEDRRVKQFMRKEVASGRLRSLTAKPVRPTAEEVAANPRSRSARLRVAERTEDSGDRSIRELGGARRLDEKHLPGRIRSERSS